MLTCVYRSTSNIPGFKLEVDLGLDDGRPGRTNNIFTLEVKQTCKVRLEAMKAYLEKKSGWDNTVLECMSESSSTLMMLWSLSLTYPSRFS